MIRIALPAVIGFCLLVPVVAAAQVAGSTVIGVSATEIRELALGWSAKRQVLGSTVYNDKNERIGTVDDIIIAPDKAVSYAIIGVGGFLGVDRHDVAVPVSQIKLQNGKYVLVGGTRDALKTAPAFEYAPPTSKK